MRKFTLLILFCLGTFFTLTAQQIQVLDAVSGEPVASVAIYNKDKQKSVITDFDGKASLEKFGNTERIYFQSFAFNTIKTTRQQVIAGGSIVKLKPNSEAMNPVVLSVSKFQQRQQDIPQSIVSTSKKEILFQNPQTSADLLQQTGQVYVQKSQQGGGSPLIRGFSTNRLLLTVDGVRMNTAIFRGGNLQNIISIDPLSVERTEVILGPGSVVYGSDAIGGVMNFFTLSPQFSDEGESFNGNSILRYSTANNEKTGHVDFNYGTTNFASTTSISINSFDDLKMGSHGPDDYLREQYAARRNGEDVVLQNDDPEVQVPTGFDQINLLQKFSYKPSMNWKFDLGLIYTATSDYSRYDALDRFRESGNPRNSEWHYGPQKWLMLNAKAQHRGNGKWYDKVIITQAFQRFDESRNVRDFQSPDLFENDEQVDAWSTAIDFERRNREDNILFYGAEYVHNKVKSTGSIFDIETGEREDAATRYPDGSTWQSLAAYISYQWKVASNFTIQSGARYNHIWLDATFDNTFFNFPFETATVNTGALTGGLGATYLPDPTLELRANLSTAFRAPNIDDIGKIFDPSPETVIVPNPDIESEYSYNAEVGFKKRITSDLTIDVAGYYTILNDALVARDFTLNGEDMIVYQGELSQVQAIQNAETSKVYGVEIGLDYKISDRFKLYGHYTWLDGKQEEEDGSEVAVRHVAPAFGDAHLVYNQGKLKLDAFTLFNGQFDFDELAPEQQDRDYLYAIDENGNPFSPSWYTINLRSQYQFTDSLSGIATLENITDQRYRTYSSGIAAAGRNLILALNYSF
ncbi:hemoglobin/transferrin/lactoferrin receptor protein [Nonlabens sp. Hel1_33_55]|uniref:TonB-dependent receptor plug domain-containing protein n=1 Tax=Nonlabens sp. Hel1_33_55 TaxID=1336802 RepID=UPI000875C7BC|nr:TonB-dependent receptor [Nonlabens sp. Hel1_33_55]SCY28735.1 hemoglobin/transferrin/lactoferrin receptor protein [Nonlabens sp. Hel1_33_55]